MQETVRIVLARCERMWKMYGNTVDAVPESMWLEGGIENFLPARMLIHVVVAIEIFVGEDDDPSASRFGYDSQKVSAEKFPSQKELKVYAEEVREMVKTKLSDSSDDILSGPPKYSSTAGSFIESIIYILRHSHHHIAEANVFTGAFSPYFAIHR